MDLHNIYTILLKHLSPDNILLIAITIGIYKIYDKVKHFDNRVEKVEKRTKKITLLLEQCPSISKKNVAWLGDDRQNSRPPEPSLCCSPNKEK